MHADNGKTCLHARTIFACPEAAVLGLISRHTHFSKTKQAAEYPAAAPSANALLLILLERVCCALLRRASKAPSRSLQIPHPFPGNLG